MTEGGGRARGRREGQRGRREGQRGRREGQRGQREGQRGQRESQGRREGQCDLKTTALRQERKGTALLLSFSVIPEVVYRESSSLLFCRLQRSHPWIPAKNRGNDRGGKAGMTEEGGKDRGRREGQRRREGQGAAGRTGGGGKAREGVGMTVRPEDDCFTARTKRHGSLSVIPDVVYRESSRVACSAVCNDTDSGSSIHKRRANNTLLRCWHGHRHHPSGTADAVHEIPESTFR